MKAYFSENKVKGENAPINMTEIPIPEPKNYEIQIKVVAIGVNRADLFIRQGLYPLRPGLDSDILGSEIAGVVTKVGKNVTKWKVGDEICSITPFGAAYAEYVTVTESYPFEKPQNISFEEASSLPIGLVTGWHNIVRVADLKPAEQMLVQGGASGMGVLAIQLGKALGAEVFATAGGDKNCKVCEDLGAKSIDYKTRQFESQGPFDVIYDILGGGEYLVRNVVSLNSGGRLTILSFIAGAKTDSGVYLGKLYRDGGFVQVSRSELLEATNKGEFGGETEFFAMVKKINVNSDKSDLITIGGDVRRRWSEEETLATLEEVRSKVIPMIENGEIKPVIDSVYDISEAEKAHEQLLKPQGHIGKIILNID